MTDGAPDDMARSNLQAAADTEPQSVSAQKFLEESICGELLEPMSVGDASKPIPMPAAGGESGTAERQPELPDHSRELQPPDAAKAPASPAVPDEVSKAQPASGEDVANAAAPPPSAIKKTPNWQVHEPSDLEYPVPHVDKANIPGVPGWRIAGVSVRGKMHAHDGRYRDDAWLAGKSPKDKWNILAVADGGGSYALARIGAEVVVKAAVETLVAKLPAEEFIDSAIHGVMADALDKAYVALEHKAEELAKERPGTSTRDLSTTLLVLVHCPSKNIVCIGTIGDGLVALQKQSGEPIKLAEADAGLSAGEVVFINNVTARDWWKRVKQYKLSEHPRFLVAMTDGVADDVVETENNFRTLFNMLAETTRCEDPATELLEFLKYEKRGSFDDRTLAVIYPERSE